MGLARLYPGGQGLGNVIVRKLGDTGGPVASRVESELDNLIAWAKDAPRVIHRRFEQVGNVGTGLDDLHSFTLDTPNRLLTNNDFIRCTYSGLFTANDDDKRLVFSIDGQAILDTGLQDIDLGVSTLVGWTAWCIYGRNNSTSVAATCHCCIGQLGVDSTTAITALPSNVYVFDKYNNLTTANLTSNAVVVKVQGESATATNNNVDQRMSIIELYQQ